MIISSLRNGDVRGYIAAAIELSPRDVYLWLVPLPFTVSEIH